MFAFNQRRKFKKYLANDNHSHYHLFHVVEMKPLNNVFSGDLVDIDDKTSE